MRVAVAKVAVEMEMGREIVLNSLRWNSNDGNFGKECVHCEKRDILGWTGMGDVVRYQVGHWDGRLHSRAFRVGVPKRDSTAK